MYFCKVGRTLSNDLAAKKQKNEKKNVMNGRDLIPHEASQKGRKG
jgi:hypothetical protein